ncbi:MAG: transglutaminase domain-containing protein, partial [Planctomycetes bacterium]|nr:transglutaminase domain-containing protein [Planctomycetota bacterium]
MRPFFPVLSTASCFLMLLAFTGCAQKSEATAENNRPEEIVSTNPGQQSSETSKSASEPSLSSDEQNSDERSVPSERSFRFHYAVTITELQPKSLARIWIPVAESNAHQQVKIIQTILPAAPQVTLEKTYGNKVFYFEAVANESGEIPLEVVYEVTRTEVTPETGHAFDKRNREVFLQANRLVPIGGKPFELFIRGHRPAGDPLSIARELYDKVDHHVKYDKPVQGNWGRGDAVWVCDSKYGNCTDFHSLFISVSRSINIPSKFEIGFPIPERKGSGDVGGYHCWAWFAKNGHWMPVDISEADKHPELKDYYFGHLSADRVLFTTGRDLQLEPAPQTGPVNFLIYPHIEVDGVLHTKISKRF